MENNLAFGQKCSSHNVLVLMIGLRFESLRTECKSEYSDGNVCVCVGGWQQLVMFQHHVQNLQRFYKMLQNNGFHKDHIKTFFGSSGQLPGRNTGGVFTLYFQNVHYIYLISLFAKYRN